MTQAHSPKQPRKSPLLAIAGLAVLAGLLGVVYVLFSATSKPETDNGYARFASGTLAALEVIAAPPAQPDLPIYDSAGAPTQMAALHGRAVLVNVWATWCAPCLTEMPTLAALATQYKDKGLLVVPISIDEPGKAAQARAMLQNLSGGALGFYIEPSKQLPFALLPKGKALGVPITILYDAKGQELARLTGGADWASPEAHALIEAALAAP